MNELALTDRESRRLKSLEDTIRRSAGDMYDAMRAIHDEKLYREEFGTWEEYCRGRWNISPQHANRLIEHGKLLSLLSEDPKSEPIGSLSEAVTREVAGLPDEKKVEIIEAVATESKAKNNGKPKVTAAAVRQKVHEHAREPGDESEAGGADPVESILRDELEREVPKHLRQHYEAAAQIKSVATKFDGIKREIKELVDLVGGVFIPLQQLEIAIKETKALLAQSRYWTDCPRCKGKPKSDCDRCDGYGFLPFSRKGQLSAEDRAYLGLGDF